MHPVGADTTGLAARVTPGQLVEIKGHLDATHDAALADGDANLAESAALVHVRPKCPPA
jgi:hypothetical protein